MKYVAVVLLVLASCSTVKSTRGCPELDSKSSCMATGGAERNSFK